MQIRTRTRGVLGAILCLSLAVAGLTLAPRVVRFVREVPDAYGQVPLHFEPSADGSAVISRRAGAAFGDDGVRVGGLQISALDGRRVSPRATSQRRGVVNYLLGNDASKWRTGVPTFDRVRYDGVWDGIDVVWYGRGNALEYDVEIAPGADPSDVRFSMPGARLVGEKLHAGGVVMRAPVAFQGSRRVDARYAVRDGVVGFVLGDYDSSRPLVIDPLLEYSTFLGGTGEERATGIAVDATGSAYVVGSTKSGDFPMQDAMQPSKATGTDIFITKLTPDGTDFDYSTYFGGNGDDTNPGIAVDEVGRPHVRMRTFSTDLPVVNAFQPTNAGGGDVYVFRLDTELSTVQYASYLGGSADDFGSDERPESTLDRGFGNAIALDASGAMYVAGGTASSDFPVLNAIYGSRADSLFADAFITKIDPDVSGSSLIWSTYYGGSQYESAFGIAVNGSDVYVTGETNSLNFPVLNAVQPSPGSAGSLTDAFVVKLTDGPTLSFATYLGGVDADHGFDIAVDDDGNGYVTGATFSTDFPTKDAFQASHANNLLQDAFLTKLTSSGGLAYSTYLGGFGDDFATGVAVDSAGRASLTGVTDSSDFPVVKPLAEKEPTFVFRDVFVTSFIPSGGALGYSTYLGGNGDDTGTAIAVGGGAAYVAGRTFSTDLATPGAAQPDNGGGQDAFVAKIADVASLEVTASVDQSTTTPGSEVTYSFTVKNNGIVFLREVFVQGHIPDGAMLAPQPACPGSIPLGPVSASRPACLHVYVPVPGLGYLVPQIFVSVGPLAPGEEQSFSYRVTAGSPGTMRNRFTATAVLQDAGESEELLTEVAPGPAMAPSSPPPSGSGENLDEPGCGYPMDINIAGPTRARTPYGQREPVSGPISDNVEPLDPTKGSAVYPNGVVHEANCSVVVTAGY